MQITIVKLRKCLELVLVDDLHGAALDVENAVDPELTNNAVGVNARQAHGLAQLFLSQRHREAVAGDMADHAKPLAKLDDQVRQPIVGRALSDIDDPLAEYCRIEQGVAPEDVANRRPGANEVPHRGMSDDGERALGERNQVVIHRRKVEILQIRQIAGNVDREDLPVAVRNGFGANAKAIHDETAFAWPVAVAQHGLVHTVLAKRVWQVLESKKVVRSGNRRGLKALKKWRHDRVACHFNGSPRERSAGIQKHNRN